MKTYQVKRQTEAGQHKGRYLMDYSRKYGDPYDVVDKAKKHIWKMKKRELEIGVKNQPDS